MTGALSALLSRSLDYAGLFPPAGLKLPDAVAEYERHLAEDRAGMLASFVCPAARLEELARAAVGRAWSLSILGPSAESLTETLAALEGDLSRLESFLDANPGFKAPALEMKVGGATDPGELVHAVENRLAGREHAPRKVFYELPWTTRWPEVLVGLKQGSGFHGAKVRTGGLEASAFPSPEAVAAFLVAARKAGVPWKATAGLHHPVRGFRREVNAKMHGFLNVFLAGAFAYQGKDETFLVRLLNEEDAGAFRFSDSAVSWQDQALGREWLSRTRAEFALSFGSCSYREPVDDLKALGLL